MTEQEKRQRRVCFTGHRPEKLTRSEEEIRQKLDRCIRQAATQGKTLRYAERMGLPVTVIGG